MRSKKKYIENLMEENGIYPVFQPIVSLRDGSVMGYEALTRIKEKFQDPDLNLNIEEMFCEAEKNGQIWKLDYLCRKAALKKFCKSSGQKNRASLFLNINPMIMKDKRFKDGFTREYLKRYEADPDKIVFEITEREKVKDIDVFQEAIRHYRGQNYQIAVDDLGSGYSNVGRVCRIRPEYIKLDISLVRDIQCNKVCAELVRSLVDFANASNIKVIAEGIETECEMEKLIQLGVHYGQGYYLSRPQKEIAALDQTILDAIRKYNISTDRTRNYGLERYYIRNISSYIPLLPPEQKVSEVMDYLEKKPEEIGFVVGTDQVVQGMMTREKFMQVLSGRYGYSLNQNKLVLHVMNRDFLCVDYEMSISEVSDMAVRRRNADVYDFIVVVREGKYFGIVTIKDLLVKASQINIEMARESNPLTGLPGNRFIEKNIEGCIQEKQPYSVLYIDLDNFKEYNDVYGFEKGDCVIRTLADILRDYEEKEVFIGHVGGDDFVLTIHGTADAQKMCEEISERFAEAVLPLYNEEDAARGYVKATGRDGKTGIFPLVSATAVFVTDTGDGFASQYELTEELARRKKAAKKEKKERFHEKIQSV